MFLEMATAMYKLEYVVIGFAHPRVLTQKPRLGTPERQQICAHPACLRLPSLETQLLVQLSKKSRCRPDCPVLLTLMFPQDLGTGELSFGILAVTK